MILLAGNPPCMKSNATTDENGCFLLSLSSLALNLSASQTQCGNTINHAFGKFDAALKSSIKVEDRGRLWMHWFIGGEFQTRLYGLPVEKARQAGPHRELSH